MTRLKLTAIAAIAGACLGTAHLAGAIYQNWLRPFDAPPDALPLLRLASTLLALAALYAVWDRASRSKSRITVTAIVSFSAALAYFGVSLHWLGHPFLFPDDTAYTLRAFLGASGAMLVFIPFWVAGWTVAAALRPLVARSSITAAVMLWAGLFSVSDILLGDLFYGIPLAPISAAVLDTPADRLLALGGVFGTTFLLLLFSASLGSVLASATLRERVSRVACPILLGVALIALPPAPRIVAPAAPLKIAVAQPSGEQRIRPTYYDRQAWMGDLARLLTSAESRDADIIVLPELSIPFDPEFDENPQDLPDLLRIAPDRALVLYGYQKVVARDDGSFETLNRYIASRQGQDLLSYDKTYLVPFGEFMPIPFNWLGFPPLAAPDGGLGTGDGLPTWSLPGLPAFAVMICYESLLSGALSRDAPDAEFLVNPTSETMLRDSLGAYQVMQYSRMRSIETGKPLFRAAQTAWSAVIGSDGTVLRSLPGLTEGIISHDLPSRRETLFSLTGYLPLYAALAGTLAASFFTGNRHRRRMPVASGKKEEQNAPC